MVAGGTGGSPLPDGDAIVDAFAKATRAFAAGELAVADAAIAAIAHDPPQSDRRPSITRTVSARIFTRDHCRCRYCRRPCLPPSILRLISTIWPEVVPYHAHGKMTHAHVAYWTVLASIDHVHAGSMGGDWRDETNLVTACWACQQAKGNSNLARLRWTLHEPERLADWDGLIETYPALWAVAGHPDPSIHAPWIRAFHGARASRCLTSPRVPMGRTGTKHALDRPSRAIDLSRPFNQPRSPDSNHPACTPTLQRLHFQIPPPPHSPRSPICPPRSRHTPFLDSTFPTAHPCIADA